MDGLQVHSTSAVALTGSDQKHSLEDTQTPRGPAPADPVAVPPLITEYGTMYRVHTVYHVHNRPPPLSQDQGRASTRRVQARVGGGERAADEDSRLSNNPLLMLRCCCWLTWPVPPPDSTVLSVFVLQTPCLICPSAHVRMIPCVSAATAASFIRRRVLGAWFQMTRAAMPDFFSFLAVRRPFAKPANRLLSAPQGSLS